MTTNTTNLIIIGTKKTFHKRPVPQPKISTLIEPEEDYYYDDVERFYREFYGDLNFMNYEPYPDFEEDFDY